MPFLRRAMQMRGCGGGILLEQLPRVDRMFGSKFSNEELKNTTRVAHKNCVRASLEVMRISVAEKKYLSRIKQLKVLWHASSCVLDIYEWFGYSCL
jgi:hypothetical protein